MKQKKDQCGLMYQDGVVITGADASELYQMHQNFVSQFRRRHVKDQKESVISHDEDGERMRE